VLYILSIGTNLFYFSVDRYIFCLLLIFKAYWERKSNLFSVFIFILNYKNTNWKQSSCRFRFVVQHNGFSILYSILISLKKNGLLPKRSVTIIGCSGRYASQQHQTWTATARIITCFCRDFFQTFGIEYIKVIQKHFLIQNCFNGVTCSLRLLTSSLEKNVITTYL